jgi:hypothetical protein
MCVGKDTNNITTASQPASQPKSYEEFEFMQRFKKNFGKMIKKGSNMDDLQNSFS